MKAVFSLRTGAEGRFAKVGSNQEGRHAEKGLFSRFVYSDPCSRIGFGSSFACLLLSLRPAGASGFTGKYTSVKIELQSLSMEG
jgi:hypothetical protein